MKKFLLRKVSVVIAASAIVSFASCSQNAASSRPPKFEDVSVADATYNVLEFLNENIPFFIATVEVNNTMARVRPFSFVMEHESKLYFCTSSEKEVSKQLKKNPYFEICACSPQGDWMRIRGKAVLETNVAVKEKSFEMAPYLAALYQEASNPDYELYGIEQGECSYNSSNGTPTKYYKLY
ncbi:MAG: pyridoxamine 5'-phosphate oxidase family protein [Prevotellaceae bacterium]|jgi:uncharacterized pyridoxamine 5'-phosphate oxidase family protein|nr:pyridoxamine 5'-phosphate oxidase family protein [Prevotellaceae bacterium]